MSKFNTIAYAEAHAHKIENYIIKAQNAIDDYYMGDSNLTQAEVDTLEARIERCEPLLTKCLYGKLSPADMPQVKEIITWYEHKHL